MRVVAKVGTSSLTSDLGAIDVDVAVDEERLVEEFRRQLDEGMWAAVPTMAEDSGRREARMVREYADIPRDAERVIFFPRAAGG